VLINAKRLAAATDGLTILIHHSGKSGASERGSSALRGAASTVLKLERVGDQLRLLVEKQRDAASIDPLNFRLVTVEFEGGASVVLLPSQRAASAIPDSVARSLRILIDSGGSAGLTYSKWRAACDHVSNATFAGRKSGGGQSGHVEQLVAAGLVEVRGERGKRGTLFVPTAAARQQYAGQRESPSVQDRSNGPIGPTGHLVGPKPKPLGLDHGPIDKPTAAQLGRTQ
jgi:hypothetical protein